MSWMQKLCEAYDAGIVCDQSKEAVRLVPLGFAQKGKIPCGTIAGRSVRIGRRADG